MQMCLAHLCLVLLMAACWLHALDSCIHPMLVCAQEVSPLQFQVGHGVDYSGQVFADKYEDQVRQHAPRFA